MAARRLIIVMLVLLGISTTVAIVVPAPKEDPAQEETSTPAGATGATGATGETSDDGSKPRNADLIEAEVSPKDKNVVVKASPGDRLVLNVDPGTAGNVEIPDLGLAGTTTPYAPVVFDVRLPSDPGRYEVIETGGEKLAVIETTKE